MLILEYHVAHRQDSQGLDAEAGAYGKQLRALHLYAWNPVFQKQPFLLLAVIVIELVSGIGSTYPHRITQLSCGINRIAKKIEICNRRIDQTVDAETRMVHPAVGGRCLDYCNILQLQSRINRTAGACPDQAFCTVELNQLVHIDTVRRSSHTGSLDTDFRDSQGDVYVVSNGNYEDVPMTLQRIDSQTDEVMQVFDFPVTNFAISGDLCYLYSFDWNTYEYAVKVLDVTTEQIVKEQFITDGTTFTIPYGIAVDPANGDVYLTEAYYNATNGDVLCFSADGRLRFKFEAGISPACLVFK